MKKQLKEIFDFTLPIVAAIVVALLLKTFVFANAIVPTGSMLNTIQENDRIIASKLAYITDKPERYDVIIFKFPDDDVNGITTYYVKRVIGLPGEIVNIKNGIVYVTDTDGNEERLRDDFITECTPNGDFGPYKVPKDSYFVLGDNRNNSLDSRYWETTNYVHKSKIIGKVMFRYYPSVKKIE